VKVRCWAVFMNWTYVSSVLCLWRKAQSLHGIPHQSTRVIMRCRSKRRNCLRVPLRNSHSIPYPSHATSKTRESLNTCTQRPEQ